MAGLVDNHQCGSCRTPTCRTPFEGAEVFTDSLLHLYEQDEAFYRAAFIAADRTGLFDHELPTWNLPPVAANSATHLCTAAQGKTGSLRAISKPQNLPSNFSPASGSHVKTGSMDI